METSFRQVTRNLSSGMKTLILPLIDLTIPLAAEVEKGRELYSKVCFNCHGNDLEGGKGPALTDAYWRYGSSPESITKGINEGIKGAEMIGYKSVFPENDIQSFISFILSKQKWVRELKREEYENVHFKGLKLTPD